MKKKFDVSTAKKLLKNYANQINDYMKENTLLKTELEDARTTLAINKELMYKHLSANLNDKEKQIFSSLREENNRISKMNQKLNETNLGLQKKIASLKDDIEEVVLHNQELIDKEKSYSFQCENIIIEKESMNIQLKKELDKYYQEDYSSTKELLIGDPNIINVAMHKELCETRKLIESYSHMLQEEIKKVGEKEEINKKLQLKILGIKKQKKIKENMENINMFGYILTTDESEDHNSQNEGKSIETFMNIESPVIKFPEKIKHPKYLSTNLSDYEHSIPKLDFTKVLKAYQPLRATDIVEGIKGTTRSHDEYIDKLKFQLKLAKNIITKYKKKNNELKRLALYLKQNLMSLQNQNSRSTKDEIPSGKKNICISKSNNDNHDILNPIDIINSKNYKFNDEESDFNYVIKEYNMTVCEGNKNK